MAVCFIDRRNENVPRRVFRVKKTLWIFYRVLYFLPHPLLQTGSDTFWSYFLLCMVSFGRFIWQHTHFSLLSSAWLPFLLTFLDIFNGCRINYNDNDIIIVFYCNQDLNVTWAGYMLSVSTAFSYFESLSWHVSCSTVKLKAWENKISEMQETFVETCSHS